MRDSIEPREECAECGATFPDEDAIRCGACGASRDSSGLAVPRHEESPGLRPRCPCLNSDAYRINERAYRCFACGFVWVPL